MKRQRFAKIAISTAALAVAVLALVGGAAWVTRGPSPHPHAASNPHLIPDMVGPIGEGASIWVQRHEVTIAEFNACHDAGGCALWLVARPDQDPANTPATGLSYPDTQQYVTWLNGATGLDFRLPRVSEWQAMAETVIPDEPDPIFTDPALSWASAYLIEADLPRALRPSGSFSTTADGIADLDGSVWEWTDDCYAGTSAPSRPDRCPAFYVAGVHVAAMSYLERDPARGGCAVGAPPAHLGMRLVSDSAPTS
ncbi:SUMF1/EgtB/PvdO family nonheme iron enzyme [Roseovarius sp. M141]|uniref:formylglycine-generating enzyme family protein n=1 Tax=Roseovarius sp. M141 TaxID=2583806 RepID=UPI0020CFBEB6|nr:SUMF1/EgtB/PvdO family nonheme iron enzyme [Roseovarius sp. M141]MCQ0091876.1 formylglycine-generating enzyme family protein [Roseovarius sp. M141]